MFYTRWVDYLYFIFTNGKIVIFEESVAKSKTVDYYSLSFLRKWLLRNRILLIPRTGLAPLPEGQTSRLAGQASLPLQVLAFS